MTAEENERLKALRILNHQFRHEPRVNHLTDSQVARVLDSMQEFAESFAKERAVEFVLKRSFEANQKYRGLIEEYYDTFLAEKRKDGSE